VRERLMAHSNVRSQLDRLEVERATKTTQREALYAIGTSRCRIHQEAVF